MNTIRIDLIEWSLELLQVCSTASVLIEKGEIVVLNPHSDAIVGTIPPSEACSVLGLSWLHNSQGESKFIAGKYTFYLFIE